MSENIRGITFAEQAVTPADDAIVRRAILGDGVLTGCEVTYSGSTLTLAPGYIIACGRSFQITTAQNFAVVDATSGVARLLLTIDLTKTATENSFDQIAFSLEYASAEDGFVDLVKDDINLSGTKYQIVCAVVSLGTGGITGILSKLEKTEGGGGGGLNFKVVPGLTQPGTAAENTIWVKTEKIGAWYFSATQLEGMQEWDVWISTGTSSAVEFNALKKNSLQVYPLSAKQMIGGALVAVEAMSYQGGKWVAWVIFLLDKANQFTDITGGWAKNTNYYPIGQNTSGSTVTINSSGITLSGSDRVVCATKNKVDVTNRSKAILKISYTNGASGSIFSLMDATSGSLVTNAVAYININENLNEKNEVELPISSLDGSYYVCLGADKANNYTVESVRLE